MQSSPLAFLARNLSFHLAESGDIPLFGQMPFFDWTQYQSLLADRFMIDSFQIDLKEQKMVVGKEILEGLGQDPIVIPILLSPMATPFFWIMSKADLSLFTSVLLTGKAKTSPFSSVALREGFYRYLLLEMIDAAKQLEPISQLTPQLSDSHEMGSEDAFCIDVHFLFPHTTCWGRIAIPVSLKKAFVHHFSHLPGSPVAMERAREIELTVGLQIGRVHLLFEEWKQIEVGDALFLDRNSYNLNQSSAIATLMLGSTPVFQARVEENLLTILEYAFYYEEGMEGEKHPEPMSHTQKNQTEDEVVAIQNYPISIAVELGRLKMTLEQLMRLSAGNTLELPIRPDQGVALTVNGRLVGRAEIVSLGESIAVRILEIAG